MKIFAYALFVATLLFAVSCTKQKSPEENLFANIPEGVAKTISDNAQKYFANSSAHKKQYIEKQVCAYNEIQTAQINLPAATYAKILEQAESKFADDFVERKNWLFAQTLSCANLNEYKLSYPKEVYNETISVLEKFYKDDFFKMESNFSEWASFLSRDLDSKKVLTKDELAQLKKRAIENSKGIASNAKSYMETQINAARRLESINAPRASLKNDFDSLRDFVKTKYPNQYEKQLAEFETGIQEIIANDRQIRSQIKAEKIKRGNLRLHENETLVDASYSKKIENIFQTSIFTKRGKLETVYTAVLTKIGEHPVILCTQEFLEGNLPVKISNSLGEIVCSRALISKNYPLIALIPDNLDKAFIPLKIMEKFSPDAEKDLCLVSHDSGAIKVGYVRIFSEDDKYFNLVFGKIPRFERDVSVKPISRDGTKFMATVSQTVPGISQSVIIDPENMTVISMAVNRYNSGVIDYSGKTGSIIGHEDMDLPDYDTLVRQFDASLKSEKPFGTIDFLRLNNLKEWNKFSIQELQRQKTEIRRYTDLNNDFLVFFKRNLYGYAMRSGALGAIAEKHSIDLLKRKMSKEMYAKCYRSYMLDVLMELKRNMLSPVDVDRYYSVYRDALRYQINLRKAMAQYVSEGIKDYNIINILHTDLLTRYNNPYSAIDITQFGGAMGSGM